MGKDLYEVRCYFRDGDKVRYINVTDVDCNDIRYKIIDKDGNMALIMCNTIKYMEVDVVGMTDDI